MPYHSRKDQQEPGYQDTGVLTLASFSICWLALGTFMTLCELFLGTFHFEMRSCKDNAESPVDPSPSFPEC